LGAVHSLAHPLSSDCGMHHGTSNAVLLPFVLEFNRPAAAQRLHDLEAQFGGGDIAAQVRDLNRRVGIAPRLRDYGAVSYTHLDVYKRQVFHLNGTRLRSLPLEL